MALRQNIKHGKKNTSDNKGFTLIEVLITMLIFIIGILGVATMQISSINGNTDVLLYSEASAFAQGQIDLLKSQPFAGIVDDDFVNAQGYAVRTRVGTPVDIDADGSDDIVNIEITIFDRTGKERSRISFLKAADI